MKKLIIGLTFLCTSYSLLAQNIVLKRVCNAGNNNQLTWQIQPNGCSILGNASLYAKESVGQAFYLVNNSLIPNSENFVHINANVPSVKNWHYFLAYTKICGTDTSLYYTDTLLIDDVKPDSTILDSVSVDPINNVVLLGWSANRTPDFKAYYLYNYDRADPRLIENYRDTFYIDITPVNPKSKSLSYDITSSDSCDNRKEYGAYQHKTIHLRGNIDTCVNSISLQWNAYVGWPVSEYHIFRSTNGLPFEWVAVVPGTQLNYSENLSTLGANITYFVRARKLNSTHISSSSNLSVIFVTGKSVNPSNTLIKQISNNTNNKLSIEITRNPISNYLNIELRRINILGTNESVHTFLNNETEYTDEIANNRLKYNYYIISKNMCGIVTDSSLFSNNIVLALQAEGDKIKLNWNRYFTWNTGVKEYTIFRASGNNINEAVNFTAEGTLTTDTAIQLENGTFPANCFYIIASDNSNTSESKSNTVCYVKAGNVYYPNAIIPNGTNKTFTFVGEGIDLQNSSISIYNRWGQIEYHKENIENGWDGTNNHGTEVNTGVYFFMAKIKVGLEVKDINGSITVIR